MNKMKCTYWEKDLLALLQSYGSEGLQLVKHSEIVLSGQAVLQLTFDPGAFGHAPMTARCQLDHPFYVKNKGSNVDKKTLQPFKQRSIDFCARILLSIRVVIILPELDRGAFWDTVLWNGSRRCVSASRTQRCQTHWWLCGLWHIQEVK